MANDVFVPLVTLGDGNLTQFRDLERGLRAFPKLYKQALVRVLARVGAGVVTDGAAAVMKRYTLKKKKITPHFRIKKASYNKPEVRVFVSAPRALHLSDWNAKQIKKGVSVKILKGGPTRHIRSAFIAPGQNSGKPIVFRRVGTSRKDIKAVYSTTGLEILSSPTVVKAIIRGANKRMINATKDALAYYLEKAGLTL